MAVPTTIQTLIFDKLFWTLARAKGWAKRHGYKMAVDETKESYRIRQRSPKDFQPGSFRTIRFMVGLKVVIGHLR